MNRFLKAILTLEGVMLYSNRHWVNTFDSYPEFRMTVLFMCEFISLKSYFDQVWL